jgi:hypothetical protein
MKPIPFELIALMPRAHLYLGIALRGAWITWGLA